MTRAKDAILQDLAREEQRLAALERTRDEARARIECLRSELATASSPAPLSLRLVAGYGHVIVDGATTFRRSRSSGCPAKTEVRIYDYVDREVPMLLRMFEKRLPSYRAIGYARGETPLGSVEPPEERTIEYDEEVLRHFEEDL